MKKHFFFLYCPIKWNNLAKEIRNTDSINNSNLVFLTSSDPEKTQLLKFMILMVQNLKLKFCHLNEHKFRQNFVT